MCWLSDGLMHGPQCLGNGLERYVGGGEPQDHPRSSRCHLSSFSIIFLKKIAAV